MKKIHKIILLIVIAFSALFFFFNLIKADAVSPCAVPFGCTGVSSITGIPYGTGTGPLGTVSIGSGLSFVGGTLSSSGLISSLSIASSNGFAGASSGGLTPTLTLSTTISGILQGNGTAISAASTTGSGNIVLATSPTLVTPTLGSATASGLTLSSLTGSTRCLHVNTSGVVSATGGDCAVGSGLTTGTTAITGGTSGNILYNNAGILGELTTTGSGTVVALQTAPTFLTSITAPIVNATTGIRINGTATAGKILVGDGTNMVLSTPTFPNASATSRKIIVSDGTNWIASIETYAVPGTSGNIMTSNGTNWTSAAPVIVPSSYFASDNVLASANNPETNTTVTYIKVKEIQVPVTATYRIKFTLSSDAFGNGFGRIYKNGVAYGTERTVSTSASATFSEDLGFTTGDLVQIYIHTGSPGSVTTVTNFQIDGTLISTFNVNQN